MDTIHDLERRLAALKEQEAKALTHCLSCNGAGFVSDSTYDRCGTDVRCSKCYGTGFPEARIAKIIGDAFSPFKQWKGLPHD